MLSDIPINQKPPSSAGPNTIFDVYSFFHAFKIIELLISRISLPIIIILLGFLDNTLHIFSPISPGPWGILFILGKIDLGQFSNALSGLIHNFKFILLSALILIIVLNKLR